MLHFSILEVRYTSNNTEHLGFYAVPKGQEEKYIREPSLAAKDLGAFGLYTVPEEEYKANRDYHDPIIYQAYELYEAHWQQSLGGDNLTSTGHEEVY